MRDSPVRVPGPVAAATPPPRRRRVRRPARAAIRRQQAPQTRWRPLQQRWTCPWRPRVSSAFAGQTRCEGRDLTRSRNGRRGLTRCATSRVRYALRIGVGYFLERSSWVGGVATGTCLSNEGCSRAAKGLRVNRIGMGLVGAGFVGPHHVDAVRRLGYVDVVAVAGSNDASGQQKAETLGAKRGYGSYQALIDDPDVHVVHIATPNHLHYEVT